MQTLSFKASENDCSHILDSSNLPLTLHTPAVCIVCKQYFPTTLLKITRRGNYFDPPAKLKDNVWVWCSFKKVV